MKDIWCELCAANGLKKKLRYCQVNFEEAILLCENNMVGIGFSRASVKDSSYCCVLLCDKISLEILHLFILQCEYPFGSTEVDSLLIKRPPQTADKRKKRSPKVVEGKTMEKGVRFFTYSLLYQVHQCQFTRHFANMLIITIFLA